MFRSHSGSHQSVERSSKESFDKALLKFVVSSTQAFRIVSNNSFQNFLECFQKFTIESAQSGSNITVRDLLPSPNTMSSRIEASMKALDRGGLNLPGPALLPNTNVNSPLFFIGNGAFPLKPQIMKPYGSKELNLFGKRVAKALERMDPRRRGKLQLR
uniref:Hermes trasposase DNA-binding domain-containing protein n=1 Tax=Ditylenchus dipsaci TaxID=166011 RepID=A0A915EGR7_9BILA